MRQRRGRPTARRPIARALRSSAVFAVSLVLGAVALLLTNSPADACTNRFCAPGTAAATTSSASTGALAAGEQPHHAGPGEQCRRAASGDRRPARASTIQVGGHSAVGSSGSGGSSHSGSHSSGSSSSAGTRRPPGRRAAPPWSPPLRPAVRRRCRTRPHRRVTRPAEHTPAARAVQAGRRRAVVRPLPCRATARSPSGRWRPAVELSTNGFPTGVLLAFMLLLGVGGAASIAIAIAPWRRHP